MLSPLNTHTHTHTFKKIKIKAKEIPTVGWYLFSSEINSVLVAILAGQLKVHVNTGTPSVCLS